MFSRYTDIKLNTNVRVNKKQKVTKRNHPVSLKSLKMRMKSIKAIGKVTTTMKVIASSKMTITQDAADQASNHFLSIREPFKPIEKILASTLDDNSKVATVIVMSNKGLCGALNSTITRTLIAEPNIEKEIPIMIGEKAKRAAENQPKLRRNVPFSVVIEDRNPMSFWEAADIAKRIYSLEFDQIRFIFNRFESLTKMYVDVVRLPSKTSVQRADILKILLQYDLGDNSKEAIESWLNYYYASALTFATTQNAAAELFFRRNAMNSASDNATEVGKKLQLLYNKTRQADITTELIEITSGAAVVEASK